MNRRWKLMASMAVLSMGLTAGAAAESTMAAIGRARAEFMAALQPKTHRPVVAVLALNEGTETTDFLVPHAILRRANVATVVAVAPQRGRVDLMPALAVHVDTDLAAFDQQHPHGADYVVVPAMHRADDPRVVAWVQAQAGNVKLVGAGWNTAFLDELSRFPSGAHDDQVDTFADALNTLAGEYRNNLAAW